MLMGTFMPLQYWIELLLILKIPSLFIESHLYFLSFLVLRFLGRSRVLLMGTALP